VAVGETARLIASLELKDQFSKTVNNALTGLTRIDKRIDQTRTKAFQTGQHIGIGIQNVAKVGLGVVAAGAGVVVASLKVAGDFEAQLNTINTVAHAGVPELKAIGDSIRAIAKTTGTSTADLTQSYYDLVSAGIKTADATNVLTNANKLAIGGIGTTAEAVDLLTTAINSYGGDATKATEYTNAFAESVAAGKTTVAEIAESFAQVGPLAAQAGISVNEIAAALGVMTATGTKTPEAITQIRSALVALQKPTGELSKLQKDLGVDFEKMAKDKGLAFAYNEMTKAAAKAGIPMAVLTGRIEGTQFAAQVAGSNFAKYTAELGKVEHASDGVGVAQAQMAERMKGLNPQIAILKAGLKDAAITIGSVLLPKITPLVAKFNELLNSAGGQAKIKAFGDSIAGLFSAENIRDGVNGLKEAFRIAGDVAPAIANAAKITGSALKVAVDLFRSLPPELQSLAVAGLAVNKLTGGLVTNLASGLISSVLKQLVSGVVNVNGAVVNVNGAGLGSLPSALPAAAGTAGGVGIGALTAAAALIAAPVAIAVLRQTSNDPRVTGGSRGFLPGQGPSTTTPGTNTAAAQRGVPGAINPTGAFIKALGSINLLGPVNKASAQAELDARRVEAAENRTGDLVSSSGAALGKHMSALQSEFHSDLSGLRKATKPLDIAKFAKAIAADVQKGAGSAKGTRAVLSDLKIKLAQTDDPKTRSVLQAAIRSVQAKLPNREWVQDQLTAAKKIVASSSTESKKTSDLVAIQKTLKSRGDTNAAKVVGNLINVAKKVDSAKTKISADTRSEGAGIRQAVRDKDLSVKVNNAITVNTHISLRDMILRQTTYARGGGH
jgi:TP901 family phage tail tape measure protein